MSTHNMFSWRNKEDISIFGMKKTPCLLLCSMQADLGLRCLHIPEDMFLHRVAQFWMLSL